MNITILACGIMREKQQIEMLDEYFRRINRWQIDIREVSVKKVGNITAETLAAREAEAIMAHIQNFKTQPYIIAMDERGKQQSSIEFTDMLSNIETIHHANDLAFIIGGAGGLYPALRDKANEVLSYGRNTWPHMLARIMLIEQLYRAQQIMIGHPYHKGM